MANYLGQVTQDACLYLPLDVAIAYAIRRNDLALIEYFFRRSCIRTQTMSLFLLVTLLSCNDINIITLVLSKYTLKGAPLLKVSNIKTNAMRNALRLYYLKNSDIEHAMRQPELYAYFVDGAITEEQLSKESKMFYHIGEAIRQQENNEAITKVTLRNGLFPLPLINYSLKDVVIMAGVAFQHMVPEVIGNIVKYYPNNYSLIFTSALKHFGHRLTVPPIVEVEFIERCKIMYTNFKSVLSDNYMLTLLALLDVEPFSDKYNIAIVDNPKILSYVFGLCNIVQIKKIMELRLISASFMPQINIYSKHLYAFMDTCKLLIENKIKIPLMYVYYAWSNHQAHELFPLLGVDPSRWSLIMTESGNFYPPFPWPGLDPNEIPIISFWKNSEQYWRKSAHKDPKVLSDKHLQLSIDFFLALRDLKVVFTPEQLAHVFSDGEAKYKQLYLK